MSKSPIKYIDRALIEAPYIGLCQDEKSFRKEMRRLKVPKGDWPPWIHDGKEGTLHTFNHPRHGTTLIVCIKEKKGIKPVQVCGLIVHESVHAWQRKRREMGEDAPSDEFEAYSIQTIACRLIAAYKYPKGKSKGAKHAR